MVSKFLGTAVLFLSALQLEGVLASTCEITKTRIVTLAPANCGAQTVTSIVTVGGPAITTGEPVPAPSTFVTSKSTTAPANGGGAIVTPTKAQTVFPSATGQTLLPSASVISGVFDGKMARFDRSSKVCQGQKETGEADTVFIAEDGATIANVIIGPNQAEGIHCRGTCTLINVWHEAVCEDAMTFKQSSGTSYVIGGGARNAADKIMQFNGKGTVDVKYFYAQKFGKVMRHCGNCSNNGGPRNSNFDGIVATGGGIVVGINTNFGDTSNISNSCLTGGTKFGDRYTGVQSGSEPKKIGACPDDKACKAVNNVASC